jgi:hypothetical protein
LTRVVEKPHGNTRNAGISGISNLAAIKQVRIHILEYRAGKSGWITNSAFVSINGEYSKLPARTRA